MKTEYTVSSIHTGSDHTSPRIPENIPINITDIDREMVSVLYYTYHTESKHTREAHVCTVDSDS